MILFINWDSHNYNRAVRVWNIADASCMMTLIGHTSHVRGLCWNHEIPYLLASGSWDSTLRLWDVREGKCLEIMKDHGADIYGSSSDIVEMFENIFSVSRMNVD